MVSTQFGKKPTSQMDELFLQVLSGETPAWRFPEVKVLRPGKGKGILTGGCLTLLCATIGTPYEIETAGKIIFIEDTDEAPYRIDRMLSYLKALKKFDRVRGVVFGQMPRCQPELLPEVILDILGEFSFPILFGFPSGHGDATVTLPIGTAVELDGLIGALRMKEPAVSR
jgi:muramoyltetrapeptide carboxypeptidase